MWIIWRKCPDMHSYKNALMILFEGVKRTVDCNICIFLLYGYLQREYNYYHKVHLLILLTSSMNNPTIAFLSSFSYMNLSWFNVCLMCALSPQLLSSSYYFLWIHFLILFSDSFFFCKKSMLLDVLLIDDLLRLITGTRCSSSSPVVSVVII